MRNAQECIRAIMPLLGGELDRMRIWLSDFDNLQPEIASRELEEALHENAKLRLEVSQEWDRRIGRDRP